MEPIKEFSSIVLTLENCIIPEERLRNTPSLKDGVNPELEVDLRLTGCEYIQSAGLLLKLPQVAMATAQILFQRFYYAKSFVKFNCYYSIIACLFLAAKIEECNRRLRDVINVFHHLRQKKRGSFNSTPMDYVGEEYYRMRNNINKYERYILKELGFCVHVQHPHKLIVACLQILECEKRQELVQKSWNYMNDGLRTNIFVRFSIQSIASACIFLAARQLQIPLPQNPPWWELFDVKYKDMKIISLELLALYQRTKRSLISLEKDIEEVKQQLLNKSDTTKIPLIKIESTPPSQTASPRLDSPSMDDTSQKTTPVKKTSQPVENQDDDTSSIKSGTTSPVGGGGDSNKRSSDNDNEHCSPLINKKLKQDGHHNHSSELSPAAGKNSAQQLKPIISPIKISSGPDDDDDDRTEKANGALPSQYRSREHDSKYKPHKSHHRSSEKRHRERSRSPLPSSRHRHGRHRSREKRSRDHHDSREYRHHHR